MTSVLKIQNLTRNEKIQVMETLWEDLSQEDERVESPAWHEAALRETEHRVRAGEERILDWRDAKEELRDLFK